MSITSLYDDMDFKSHFRLAKSSVQVLMCKMKPLYTSPNTNAGRPVVDFHKVGRIHFSRRQTVKGYHQQGRLDHSSSLITPEEKIIQFNVAESIRQDDNINEHRIIQFMENTGTSPLEVANPSNKTSLETPDLSLEVLNKTQQLIDLGSPSKSPSPTENPKERSNLFRSPSERQSAKIKHSLARSLSLDNKKVTRSKVTDDFAHTELTFGRKPRVKKMVTIKLKEAFKLIPMCTGEDDIYPFINACDMAVNLVEE
ncbi:hypothetical protein AGLY_014375 [Aphis glycines]|uniref:Myb-like protein D n=1 Tax=Aphis glycines TaxID=307491 RepID=A0A6G0T5Y9_APHGL|nr:hypothetical protein AGLY_014375 [Aphis glycines]